MNNISTRDDTSCNYTNLSPGLSLQMYSNITDHHDQDHHHHHHDGVNNNMNAGGADADVDVISTASAAAANSLVYGLSVLKDKVSQLHSLAAILLSPPPDSSSSSSSAAAASSATMSSMHSAIQEIIMTSSSMLLTFQHHMGLVITSNNSGTNNYNSAMTNIGNAVVTSRSSQQLGQALIYPSSTSNDNPQSTVLDWPYGHDDRTYNNNCTITTNKYYNNNNMIMTHYSTSSTKDHHDNNLVLLGNDHRETSKGGRPGMVEVVSPKSTSNYDIVELDASDLLAKYTHYCQVCGKGFKRDANLRMHMRAHGDEYKTSAALSNPMKKINDRNDSDDLVENFSVLRPKKYSCPQEGCRWNQRHAKFQPLKSMICVKNHYKRSHCPKMYVCKRCNRKQFSVLSDLRTHEKHCGDLKWQCSCGTTFSRKDKLMGHVTLFVGHTPVMLKSSSSSFSSYNRIAKVESQVLSQSQIDSIVNMIE